jgi:hypothetical protein
VSASGQNYACWRLHDHQTEQQNALPMTGAQVWGQDRLLDVLG